MQTSSIGRGHYRISSDYLILLAEMAFEHGISAKQLLHGSQLEESLLLQPGVLVGHESGVRCVENFCQLLPEPQLALEYGKRMTLSKHGALGYAAQYSATMTDAAIKVMRYVETRAQIFTMQRHADAEQRQLFIQPKFNSEYAAPFLVLAFLASIETICRTLVGSQGGQTASCIELSWDWSLAEQTILPHCQILSGASDNCLTWPSAALQAPLPFFDPTMEHMAEQELEQALRELQGRRNVSDQVRDLIADRLQQPLSLEQVAGKLHMSMATLNRKLKQEHTSYQHLKDELRQQQARHMLRTNDLTIDQIAEQLGYSDASNFTKAFKAWTGMPPSVYRRQG
jgi:AraC-like DNA-binding protein